MAAIKEHNQTLYGAASGVIKTITLEDDILSRTVTGSYTAKSNQASVLLGKIDHYTDGFRMFPVMARRSVRDRDTFMQVDPDGKILLVNVVAGTEYTFHQSLPFTS